MNSDFVFICGWLFFVLFVITPLSCKKPSFEKLKEESLRRKKMDEHLHNRNKEMQEEEEK